LWFQIPKKIQRGCESGAYDFMGALHAVEHAAIGILPLLVMADHRDVGGMSTNYHPQTGGAVIFIYDGVPGGAGLTLQAFAKAQDLIQLTLNVIRSCPCESGCPSCIHSPQCGSGNRPMDKSGAVFILEQMKSKKQDRNRSVSVHPVEEKFLAAKPADTRKTRPERVEDTRIKEPPELYFGVLDLETQRSAAEVGGWHRADRMGISCGVLYDSTKEQFLEFLEDQTPQLVDRLFELDLIVGFNIKRFDYLVLKKYSNRDFSTLNTLDVLEEVHQQLGFRLSLAHLAQETLRATKTGDGLQALRWWQQGRIREILDYCKMDVKLTRDLFLFGRQHGHLIFRNRDQKRIQIPVSWNLDRLRRNTTSEDSGQLSENR
jgi:DEAD/DEAH box helicase domain-containing protein